MAENPQGALGGFTLKVRREASGGTDEDAIVVVAVRHRTAGLVSVEATRALERVLTRLVQEELDRDG